MTKAAELNSFRERSRSKSNSKK